MSLATGAANSIEFYSSSGSSSTNFSKSEFKFEFFYLIVYEFKFELDKNKLFRIQADEYYNFFTAGAHAIRKIKIFRSCSRVKTIPQLFSAIEIVSVVDTIEQQTIFRSDLLFLFNNLNIFLMNSNSFIRVRVQKKYFFEFKFEFGKMLEFKLEFATLLGTLYDMFIRYDSTCRLNSIFQK